MYDVVVIGAGPGGYACAIRAAQLGAKTCIIEKNGMGGTCTQRGCIPTKYLHSFGDIMRRATAAKKNGINASIQLDYNLLKSKMTSTVSKLAAGIEMLLKSNNVDIIPGEARIVSQKEIVVNNNESSLSIETKNIVIATGSYPTCLGGYHFEDNVLSTTSILELESLPHSIIVVGGGYSGCEFAAILNTYGCKVTMIEAEKTLLPGLPNEVGNTIEKYMRIDGIDVITDSRVDRITNRGAIINGKEIEASKLLICIGRKPIIVEELNKIGVSFNQRGIIVNEKLQTNVNNIYAIGDVTGMYELAHVASKQGEVAAENIMGIGSIMDYRSVPVCVFTYPEIAFVGQLSGEKIGVFPLTASAKASCLGESRGFVKVYDKGGIIVGVLIIAPHAGEMISEAVLAVRMNMKIEDVQDTIHAHPTLPESFLEAVRDVNNIAIHLPTKGRKSDTK
ncbi:MAG: dihydrolipoyl dehydrogenase [Thermoproteota archaeon]|nr:dihydrolipoyl dehydrogenase [Thermoproteota archaeon]